MQVFPESGVQALKIGLKSGAAGAGQSEQGLGHFAAVGLLDVDVAGFLQFGKMAGEVAFVQFRLTRQVKEIALFHRGEERDDHHSPGFVDHPIQLGNGPKLFVHVVSARGRG